MNFKYQLCSRDVLRIYPENWGTGQRGLKQLRAPLPRKKKFVVDSHLGKLARHLRLLGCDCRYEKIFPDERIVESAVKEKRIVLTRDIGLLKNHRVTYGHWVRSTDPKKQLVEVVKKYKLYRGAKPFTRCLACNGQIKKISKAKVLKELPEQVRQYYRRFYLCRSCRKLYWKGSHYTQLSQIIASARKARPVHKKISS